MPFPQPCQVLTDGAAFVDSSIVPLSEAKISMLDWGFLHSDATYDVAHVWEGSFFRLEDHLDRFHRNMQYLRMALPYDRASIKSILVQCVRATGLQNAYVEMICTRGIAPQGSRDPRLCENRFYAFVVPFAWIADVDQRTKGLRLHISSVRRISPESVNPTVKNYHWLDLTRGLFEAYDEGHETVVLTDSRNNIVEGPGFNIFAVIDGKLVTPSSGVLEGVTRGTVIEIAEAMGCTVSECELAASELYEASEVFITSTAGGVMPVGWIDGKRVGRDGGGASVTQKICDAYWDAHTDPRYCLPVYTSTA